MGYMLTRRARFQFLAMWYKHEKNREQSHLSDFWHASAHLFILVVLLSAYERLLFCLWQS